MPKVGDKRERNGFAWLPIKLDDKTYFFEKYSVKEVYGVKISERGLVSHDWIVDQKTTIKRSPKYPKGFDKANGKKS